jgi:hypothetical protein
LQTRPVKKWRSMRVFDDIFFWIYDNLRDVIYKYTTYKYIYIYTTNTIKQWVFWLNMIKTLVNFVHEVGVIQFLFLLRSTTWFSIHKQIFETNSKSILNSFQWTKRVLSSFLQNTECTKHLVLQNTESSTPIFPIYIYI